MPLDLLAPAKKRLTRISTVEHLTPYLRDEVVALGFEVHEDRRR